MLQCVKRDLIVSKEMSACVSVFCRPANPRLPYWQTRINTADEDSQVCRSSWLQGCARLSLAEETADFSEDSPDSMAVAEYFLCPSKDFSAPALATSASGSCSLFSFNGVSVD